MTPTDRIALHLADVKNADKANFVQRSETDQRLEALERYALDLQAEISALNRRLPRDLEARVAARLREMPGEQWSAHESGYLLTLVKILSGADELDDACESCGDPECPA